MFGIEYRNPLRDRVLELASSDSRVVAGAIVGSLEREELLHALGLVMDGPLNETEEVRELAPKVEPQLRELRKETLS